MYSLGKYLALLCLTQCLLACGGGSSGDTNTPPATNSSSVVSSSSMSSSSSDSEPGSSQSSSSSVSVPGSSSSSSSIPTSSLSAPQNLTVSGANRGVSLQWSPVAGATAYHIFYATEPGIMATNYAAYSGGTWLAQVTPPYVVGDLDNGQTYYFVVTAFNASTESAQSLQVSAQPQALANQQQPTAQEVLILELVNRARFDPEAEAQRFGIGLNDGGTSIPATRKPPLAHNGLLMNAAREHSQWMLDADIFSHTGMAGSTVTERILAADYQLSGAWAVGENIAWQGTTGNSINMTQAALSHHEGLFRSAGHRVNMLSTNYRELGVGQMQGMFLHTNNINYLSSMVTQNFARSANHYFLTGVVYEDSNGDNFYTPGEGLSGAVISVNGQAFSALDTGAYAIPLGSGTYQIAIGGAGLDTTLRSTVQISAANQKLDVITGSSVPEMVNW